MMPFPVSPLVPLVGVAVVGGLAYALWPRPAAPPPLTPELDVTRIPPPPPAPPSPTPAPSSRTPLARVVAFPAILVRSRPSLTAPIVSHSARTGRIVTVLQTGIPPEDRSGGEWWRIRAPDGKEGFSRAVDPSGTHNFTLFGPNPAPAAFSGCGFGSVPAAFAGCGFGADPRMYSVPPPPRTARPTDDSGRLLPTPPPVPSAGSRRPAQRPILPTQPATSSVTPAFSHRHFGPHRWFEPLGSAFPAGTSYLATYDVAPSAGVAMRCVAPSGCYLRAQPGAAPSGLIVENGGLVTVRARVPGPKTDPRGPGPGGWTAVVYREPLSGSPIEGWLPSEWLVAAV